MSSGVRVRVALIGPSFFSRLSATLIKPCDVPRGPKHLRPTDLPAVSLMLKKKITSITGQKSVKPRKSSWSIFIKLRKEGAVEAQFLTETKIYEKKRRILVQKFLRL
jgi:hypothetical protein